MELRHLRTALAAARHGSVNDTAAALDLAPSSVSQRIRELEHEVGVPLFDRTNRGIRPTARGRQYLASIAAALRDIDDATHRLQEREEPVRVGALQGITSGLLQPLLDRVCRDDPDLPVVLHPDSDRSLLLRMLQAGDVDVVLLLDAGDRAGELGFDLPVGGFDFLDVRPVALRAVCGPDHPLRGTSPSLATLRRRGDLVGQEQRCSYWLATQSWLGPHASLTAVGGLAQVKEWVRSGRGIAVLPDFLTDDDVDSGRLHVLPIEVPDLLLRMMWRRDVTARPAQRKLVYALSQV